MIGAILSSKSIESEGVIILPGVYFRSGERLDLLCREDGSMSLYIERNGSHLVLFDTLDKTEASPEVQDILEEIEIRLSYLQELVIYNKVFCTQKIQALKRMREKHNL